MKIQYLFHGFVTGMTMLFSLSHVLAQPGNLCGATQNPLTGNYEIPMDGYNYHFSDPAGTLNDLENFVIIGGDCSDLPPAKLTVYRNVTVNNQFINIGVGISNVDNAMNTNNLGFGIGIAAEAAGPNEQNAGVTGRASNGSGNFGGYFAAEAPYISGAQNANNTAVSGIGRNGNSNTGGSFWAYGTGNASRNMGIYAGAEGSNLENLAGHFIASSNTGDNYGIRAYAANGTNNYAIFATSLPSSGNNPPTGPNYAGYFNGDVLRTGTDNFTSDLNLKKEIQAIQNGISTVAQLNPVTFEFKQEEYPSIGLSGGTNYGFIAQEVEKILPDLVREEHHPAQYDKEGNLVHEALKFKSMNYQGIIPVLTKAIQEQNELINDLNSRLSQLENCLSRILPSLCQINHGEIRENSIDKQQFLENIMNVELSGQETVILNQNIPNPFAESTMITYNIPENVKSAQLHFYDALGKLIKTVDLTSRGSGYIHVFGADLATGAYTYALVADGQIVSTRKMVKE